MLEEFNSEQIVGNTDIEEIAEQKTSCPKKIDPIMTHVCCDVVLNKDGVKYIAGTNQLFPVFVPDFCNGGKFDISLYLYTAMKWRDLFYTSDGAAVDEDDDPDAYLGYDHGIDILHYKNATPCLVPSYPSGDSVGRKEKPLTIDQWCRLTSNGVLTKEFMPKLWVESEIGHSFWTPNKGLIKALPVDLPLVLYSAEKFCNLTAYKSGTNVMLQRVNTALNLFMGKNNYHTLYIGFTNSLSEETDEDLIKASDWSKTHSRRVGMVRTKTECLEALSDMAATKLAMALASNGFEQEEIFA